MIGIVERGTHTVTHHLTVQSTLNKRSSHTPQIAHADLQKK